MVASLKKPPDPEGKTPVSSEGAESWQEQGHGRLLRATAVACSAPPSHSTGGTWGPSYL